MKKVYTEKVKDVVVVVTDEERSLGQKIYSWAGKAKIGIIIITGWKKNTRGVPTGAMKIVVNKEKVPAVIGVIESIGDCHYRAGRSWLAVEGKMTPGLQRLLIKAGIGLITKEEYARITAEKEKADRIFKWARSTKDITGVITDWKENSKGVPLSAVRVESVEQDGLPIIRVTETMGKPIYKTGFVWLAISGFLPRKIERQLEKNSIELSDKHELLKQYKADALLMVNRGKGYIFLKKEKSHKPGLAVVKIYGESDYTVGQSWLAKAQYLPEEIRVKARDAGLL